MMNAARLKQLRWCFSIRSLMIVVALCAMPAAWIGHQRSTYIAQWRTVNEIRSRIREGSRCLVEFEPASPKWVRPFVPKDAFIRITLLQFFRVSKEDIEVASHLAQVDDLNFFMGSVTDADVDPFRHVAMRVENLGLAYTQVTDDGVECFAGLRGLRSLDLRWCTAVDGKCLRVFQHTPMEDLDLSGTGLTAENVHWIRSFPGLRRLSLTGCRNAGCDISLLSDLEQLEVLELSDTSLDDQGARTLANFRRLKRLKLSMTDITDAGVHHLQSLPDLETLHLCCTAIGDDALQMLVCLESLQNLRIVDTRVTDDGIRYLTQMKALKMVWVDASAVTDDAVGRLRKQCPLLSVFHTQEVDGWP